MQFTKTVILTAVITAIAITMLFLVVPITGTFIVSYIFALIAIGLVSLTLFFSKSENEITYLANINTSVTYAVINIIISIIACLIPIATLLTFVIHFGLLSAFVIREIVTTSGGKYIDKLDKQAEEKHKAVGIEKETYWK
ncbi:MAG: hypothetical protein IJN62_02545 [Clostridia bacterium]|nr:hypothetical protein [Clostridia bacterium]